jgi:flagellar basal-body rod protein FlgG
MAVCESSGGTLSFQLQLCRFPNPSGLEVVNGNLFRETAASGASETGNPGVHGFGSLEQGYLEGSNVDLNEELVELTRIRNACRALVKVARARQHAF